MMVAGDQARLQGRDETVTHQGVTAEEAGSLWSVNSPV